MGPGGDLSLGMEDEHVSAELIRSDHLMEHGDRNARIMTQAADPPVAWIEMMIGPRLAGERQMITVVVANADPQCTIAGCCSEFLDPGVLVGRNDLVGQLAADPMRFLC